MTNHIQNLIEPIRLFLVWQRQEDSGEPRYRRVVGEICKSSDGEVFRYLRDTDDFRVAQKEGFRGFPAFKDDPKIAEFRDGVLPAFVRRLPPRNREDFDKYLAQYRLKPDFSGSDMALLAYTGAKLPSDGFEIIPDLSEFHAPIELLMEVAGFRHQGVSPKSLSVGDPIKFVLESENPVDKSAIAIYHRDNRIGYVARPCCAAVRRWLDIAEIEASIERINGKSERPLIYIFAKITSKS